jgi:glycosyltransferase involved in cell wall biosynthesis
MFSMTPLFPNKNMGGAQKQLKRVALHLGNLGHDVTILTTWRQDASEPFTWGERVRILPIFRFKQPFPEPYATPPYNIAAAIQDIGDYLDDSDRFYLHDGGFMFPYAYQHVPTVVSFRSVIFSETLQSAFLFRGDELILISEHQAAVFQNTVGRFFPEYRDRLHIIYNGCDWDVYKPTPPDAILERIPVDPEDDLVLYPHRPEAPKGIQQTIAVVDQLVHRYGLTRVRALVPRWIDAALDDDVRAFYDGLQRDIDARGLREHFVFHDWVPEDLLPAFYSLGRVTLCLGSYVETFGNVAYESLGCGTPAVVARVGPNRDLLPEHLVDLVDYGDVDAAAAKAADIIRERKRTPQATLDYLHRTFTLDHMMQEYADVILNAQTKPALAYQHTPIDAGTVFTLAPWCYIAQSGVYHDFLGSSNSAANLLRVVQAHPDGFTASEGDVTFEQAMRWYRDGYLVPKLPWTAPVTPR